LDAYLELGAQGTRGGILLAWNMDMISVSNAVNRTFTISVMVKVISASTPFLFTTCYGPQTTDTKMISCLNSLRLSQDLIYRG
jgi:hypothetical protein